MRPDRRKFIKDSVCAALGGASVYSAIGQMSLLQAATHLTSATYSDYKALICVFLYGGNDSFNTVVPISGAARTAYDKTRPTGTGLIGARREHAALAERAGQRRGQSRRRERLRSASVDDRSGDAVQRRSCGDRRQRRHAGPSDAALGRPISARLRTTAAATVFAFGSDLVLAILAADQPAGDGLGRTHRRSGRERESGRTADPDRPQRPGRVHARRERQRLRDEFVQRLVARISSTATTAPRPARIRAARTMPARPPSSATCSRPARRRTCSNAPSPTR